MKRGEDAVIPRDASVSGRAYVNVRLRTEVLDLPTSRIRVRKPRNCDHGHSICTDCVGSWARDYEVHLGDTQAGRAIARVWDREHSLRVDS